MPRTETSSATTSSAETPERAAPPPEATVGDGTVDGGSGADFFPEELAPDVFQRGCSSRQTLEIVAAKWGVLAIAALRDGSVRFNALRRKIDGVSEKMLSQTLQALERDGLVVREVRETIPPHVEYSLTEIGTQVSERLVALIRVIEDVVPEVVEAREAYDARRQA